MSLSYLGFGSLVLLAPLILAGGGAGLPLGMPPMPPDPVMARVAPEECLYYLSWNGTVPPDAASENQTEQLLARPELHEFLTRIEAELLAALERNLAQTADAKGAGRDLAAVVKKVLSRPTAFYVSAAGPGEGTFDVQAALVVRWEDEDDAREAMASVERWLPAMFGGPVERGEFTVEGIAFRRLPLPGVFPGVWWGLHEGYLVAVTGQQAAAALLARFAPETSPPTWLAALQERLPVERPSMTGYIDVRAVEASIVGALGDARWTAAFEAAGLSNVQSVGSVTGLDRDGISTQTLLAVEGEPRGLLALLSGPPLSAADLAVIPRQATWATAVRFDFSQAYARLLEGIDKFDPVDRESLTAAIGRAERAVGFELDRDLLRPLGDVWCVYSSLNLGQGEFVLTGTVRDRRRLERTMQALLNLGRAILGAAAFDERDFGGETIYSYSLEGSFPNLAFRPAWCLGKDRLWFALTPATVENCLAADSAADSLAATPEIAQLLAAEHPPQVVTYQDTAAVLRWVYLLVQAVAPPVRERLRSNGVEFDLPELPPLAAVMPHAMPMASGVSRTPRGLFLTRRQSVPLVSADAATVAPISLAMFVPSLQATQEALRRAKSAGNLSRIGAALRGYERVFRSYPPTASRDAAGRPLLSWRVYMLPFLDELELYRQFRLDEPWDSDHNRPLAERIPAVYRAPNLPDGALAGTTTYLAATGEGAFFDSPHGTGVRSADVADGLERTIMVVEAEAAQAVYWTAPDDLPVDLQDPFKGLGARGGGFQALFGDGAVRFFEYAVGAPTLRALFTRAAGDSAEPE